MSESLIIFASMFVLVFCKSFQQRNVAYGNYKMVWVIGALFAVSEFAFVAVIAQEAITRGEAFSWLVLPMWIGASSGCNLGMWMHKKVSKNDLLRRGDS